MPFVLRTTTDPTLAQIAAIPQIVIVDKTGPAIVLGTAPVSSCLVGEFLAGPYSPIEVGGPQELANLYGGVSPFFSQDASGRQNGGAVSFNGNGMLQLKGKTFGRLVIQRVDTRMVTTDGGTTVGAITLTLTVDPTDQNGGGTATNKDLVIPAGTRIADNASVGLATALVAVADNILIPAGTAVGTNALQVSVPVFSVFQPEAIAAISSATLVHVIDTFVQGGASGTTISTTCTQPTALWPPGTGTTLSLRIESQYPAAITKTLPSDVETVDIAVIWSARRSAVAQAYNVQKALLANANGASGDNAQGRIALASPDPAAGTTPSNASSAKTAAIGYAAAAAIQSDRMILCWPHTQIFSTELGSVNVTISPEGWMASVLSQVANEVNPGVQNQVMANIANLEPCFVANPLTKTDYQNLQAGGVSAIQHDKTAGWWFVNGVTAVDPTANPTRVPIKRRRMADEIQATLAAIAAPYLKQPATTERIDAFVSEVNTYLQSLNPPNDPSRQRINGFFLDQTSGNTEAQLALGIFVLIVEVKTLASMDDIVFQTAIGETVTLPVQEAA